MSSCPQDMSQPSSGHVPAIVRTCPSHCQDMSQPLSGHVPAVLRTCPSHCQDMSQPLSGHVPAIHRTCPSHCQDMSQLSIGHVSRMAGTCGQCTADGWNMSHRVTKVGDIIYSVHVLLISQRMMRRGRRGRVWSTSRHAPTCGWSLSCTTLWSPRDLPPSWLRSECAVLGQ